MFTFKTTSSNFLVVGSSKQKKNIMNLPCKSVSRLSKYAVSSAVCFFSAITQHCKRPHISSACGAAELSGLTVEHALKRHLFSWLGLLLSDVCQCRFQHRQMIVPIWRQHVCIVRVSAMPCLGAFNQQSFIGFWLIWSSDLDYHHCGPMKRGTAALVFWESEWTADFLLRWLRSADPGLCTRGWTVMSKTDWLPTLWASTLQPSPLQPWRGNVLLFWHKDVLYACTSQWPSNSISPLSGDFSCHTLC